MISGSEEVTALIVLVGILTLVLILLTFLARSETALLRSISRGSPFERALAEQQPKIESIRMPKRETGLSATDTSLALLTAAGAVVGGHLLREAILAAWPDIEKSLRKRLEEGLQKQGK